MEKNNIISDWLDQYGNPKIDKFVETKLNQNKMKQTAVEWLYDGIKHIIPNDFLQKFEQAKAMEKEQMCGFAEFVATYSDKNKNYLGEMLHSKSKYDGAERTIDLLETFKSE